MTAWRILPDGHNEPTLWAADKAEYYDDQHAAPFGQPRAVVRRCEVPPAVWALCRALGDPSVVANLYAANCDEEPCPVDSHEYEVDQVQWALGRLAEVRS